MLRCPGAKLTTDRYTCAPHDRLYKALMELRIHLSGNDFQVLFDKFDREDDGLIQYEDLSSWFHGIQNGGQGGGGNASSEQSTAISALGRLQAMYAKARARSDDAAKSFLDTFDSAIVALDLDGLALHHAVERLNSAEE